VQKLAFAIFLSLEFILPQRQNFSKNRISKLMQSSLVCQQSVKPENIITRTERMSAGTIDF